MNHFIDHAATTPTDPDVLQRIARRLGTPANASSVHRYGQDARTLLEECRERMAVLLGVASAEVVFTASATEANNLAIRGFVEAVGRVPLLLTSALEHACVRQTVASLVSAGRAKMALLPVGEDGVVSFGAAPAADFLAMMWVQNETGVRQPLEQARQWAAVHEALWLCDATQAVATESVSLPACGADLLSLSSHKVYGPPGVGVLAGRAVPRLVSQITGGPQEQERRAGTQPVALIEGFVLAAERLASSREDHRRHLASLTEAFHRQLNELGVSYRRNGADHLRAPGFINISLAGIHGPDAVIALDARGFSVSSGSACATGVMEPSPALLAMVGDDEDRAAGAIRITPGRGTTVAVMQALAEAIAALTRSR